MDIKFWEETRGKQERNKIGNWMFKKFNKMNLFTVHYSYTLYHTVKFYITEDIIQTQKWKMHN